ncbi:MAG: Asp-tRNA(Asn)/Glu-tRNA(Gln) amidotransferase subunit GatB [Burkholderiaceae bacterium]|nr:Asp-tRNA(Asn)/Glu-tRNA(Gln) amidotransferase subunit GatB [Burkholderiaceae bacterium]
MNWEIVIGLECHVQLKTRSKIFSPASTQFGAPPNTQAHMVDMALPGVLPVMNREAAACAIRFGLAVGGRIAPRSIFARKNYFYPDLPKGYQISQYEIPVVSGGRVTIVTDQGARSVELTRAHLEEDAGKSIHEGIADLPSGCSGIDLNRAGTPLLEIVSEPVMRSAKEAAAYARALHSLVTWIGICDGNLQEGSFRVDANVSVRPIGDTKFGTRCEIKNLNSFRFLERAIEVEAQRQIELIEDGGTVVQETRLYDPDAEETRAMRSKEDAHDYRYFPDPDLPPLLLDEAWIKEIQSQMPELPEALRARLVRDHSLSDYDAAMVTASRDTADYFFQVLEAGKAAGVEAKLAANWIMGDIASSLNRDGIDISGCKISASQLAGLISRVVDGTISNKIARDVFAALWSGEFDSADAVIQARGLKQIQDTGMIAGLVEQAIADNPKMVEEFRGGKEKALNALVGQVMKKSQGKANPQQVTDLIKAKLQS